MIFIKILICLVELSYLISKVTSGLLPPLEGNCGLDANEVRQVEIKDEDTIHGSPKQIKFGHSGYCHYKRFALRIFHNSVTGDFRKSTNWKFELNSHLYQLHDFHFHWSPDPNNDAVGSEHVIDGKGYPLEMHLVNLRTDMRNVTQALKRGRDKSKKEKSPKLIVVIAILFEVDIGTRFDHEELASITNSLHCLNHSEINKRKTHPLNGRVNLTELFPTQTEAYVYDGSLLTNSNCLDMVNWIVYKQPVQISKKQFDKFRNLWSNNGTKVNAMSPIFARSPSQAVKGRIITRKRVVAIC